MYMGRGKRVKRKEALERAKLCEPRWAVNTRVLELEMAEEILAEEFHAQSGEVEEMMQSRLVDRRWQRWPGSTSVSKI